LLSLNKHIFPKIQWSLQESLCCRITAFPFSFFRTLQHARTSQRPLPPMAESYQKTFDRLCLSARETALLRSTFSLLGWDEQTGMPPAAADYRGEQMAYLAGIIHRRRTDSQLGDWLEQLVESPLCADRHSVQGTIVRESKRQFERQSKLPEALVMELTRTSVQGQHDWQQAREKNDFSIFMPSLTKTG